MNEEVLEIEDGGAQTTPAVPNDENPGRRVAGETAAGSAALQGAYKLDWQDAEISLSKGRFSHTLSRPTAEMIIAREDEIQAEIPIARDGSFALPDSTASEETDAKYYDLIAVKTTGYKGAIPTAHKAAAFQGLYRREIYLDPECDIFADEVTVIEEIGGGDEPDFTIRHTLRQPTEAELKKCRQANGGGRLMPDKRGRQKLVTASNLRSAMRYYSTWLIRLDGACAGGSGFSPDRREEFVALVDPLIQRKVVNVLVDELTGSLLD